MIVWTVIKLALAFAVVWIMGYAALGTAFGRGKLFAPVERFFLAFMLGAGALTVVLTYQGFLGISLRFGYCLVVSLLVAVPWLVWLSKNGRLVFDLRGVLETLSRALKPGKEFEGILRYVLLLVIVYQCLFVSGEALLRPFNKGDALGFWALNIKMINVTHQLPAENFATGSPYYSSYHNATMYPPMLYLLGYWISSAAGFVSSSLCKSLLIFYYVGFLALFYYALRRIVGKMYSLAFTAFLGLVPVVSRGFTVFYADPFLTAILSLAVIYLYLFIFYREREWLLLSSLFFTLAAWLKVEGVVYFIFGVMTLVIFLVLWRGIDFQRKVQQALLFIIVPVLIILPYYGIRAQRHGAHSFINPKGEFRKLDYLKEIKLVDDYVMPMVYENLASYRPYIYQYRYFRHSKLGDWLFVWSALFFGVLISPSRIFKAKIFYLLFYLLLFFAFHYYLGVMLGPHGPGFHFSRGFSRHFMHCTGFVVLIIAVLLYPRKLSDGNREEFS